MILSTSEPNGFCFVETAELDGETNLKCRQSLSETVHLGDNIDQLASFDGEIICEAPNNNLTKFEGTLFWKGEKYPVDNDKMLLRGCILRNTKWCFGLVIFAGRDTKLMQNSGKTVLKRTKSDRLLNILIMGIVMALLTMCLFTSIACGFWEMLVGRYFSKFLPQNLFTTQDTFTASTITAILTFFSYLIVLNTVVPISLYVSVEVNRYCQSLLIDSDEKMYFPAKDSYAKARTTTLNEELGQVQYIFSDKTGTLTQNLMTFNKCSINGILYGEVKDFATGEMIDVTAENEHLFEPVDFGSFNPKFYEEKFKFYDQNLLDQVVQSNAEVHEFFTLLAVCHTVMSEEKQGRLEYQAQSPDEAALSSAARNFGFVFKNRTSNTIEIEVLGKKEVYELLAILDFNNVRKRMSVIVRQPPNGNIKLYCKGADSVIFEHLAPIQQVSRQQARLRQMTQEHLEQFAGVGLRTLCLAKKELPVEVYEKWQQQFHQAVTSIENREEQVDRCYELIETDLELMGATAIEDKLQDRVPQTIANLLASGIKLWVLTGDKQETAINIGYSCELLQDEMCEIFIIDGCFPEEVEKQLRKSLKQMAKAQQQQTQHQQQQHHYAAGRPSPSSTPSRQSAAAQLYAAEQQQPVGAWRPGASRAARRRPRSAAAANPRPPSSGRPPAAGRSSRNYVWPAGASAKGSLYEPAALRPQPDAPNETPLVEVATAAGHPHEPDHHRLDTTEFQELADELGASPAAHQRPGSARASSRRRPSSGRAGRRARQSTAAAAAAGTPLPFLPLSAASLQSLHAPRPPSQQTAPPPLPPPPPASPRPPLGAGDPSGGFALVINGQSLAHALCPSREQLFLQVASQCKSVICCRVTPLQKALVVDLVKRHKKVITLSIGDGANDVSMLKMAHIGVGISGQEGMQAVLASDFSIAQFCYLERLLLVHGRWSYFRMCKFLRYFFYKNFSFTLCNLWYAFFCGFSAQVSVELSIVNYSYLHLFDIR